MADFIEDTFTAPVGTLLSAHVGETGATWTIHDALDSLTLDGQGGVFGVFDSTNARFAVASGVPPSASYIVRCVLKDLGGATFDRSEVGLLARFDIAGGNGYGLWLNNLNLILVKFTAFVLGSIGAVGVPFDPAISPGTTVDLVICGNRLAVNLNDVEQTFVVDNSFSAAGSAGLFSNGNPSTATTGVHITKFQAFQSAPGLIGCACVSCSGGVVTFALTSNGINTFTINYLNGSGWLTVDCPVSGNGTVTATAASNAGGTYRQAQILIVDAVFLITQAGGC